MAQLGAAFTRNVQGTGDVALGGDVWIVGQKFLDTLFGNNGHAPAYRQICVGWCIVFSTITFERTGVL